MANILGRARRLSELVGLECLVRILIGFPPEDRRLGMGTNPSRECRVVMVYAEQLERMEITVVERMELTVVEAARPEGCQRT